MSHTFFSLLFTKLIVSPQRASSAWNLLSNIPEVCILAFCLVGRYGTLTPFFGTLADFGIPVTA